MSDQLSLCLFWDIDTYFQRWENDKITAPVKRRVLERKTQFNM